MRIKLKANDHESIDRSAQGIIKALKLTDVQVKGPIPLPTKKFKYAIPKSPHAQKKAREAYQQTIHKRLIDIPIPDVSQSHKVLDALMKIDLKPGVTVEISE